MLRIFRWLRSTGYALWCAGCAGEQAWLEGEPGSDLADTRARMAA